MKTQQCRHCHGKIIWAVDAATKRREPIDADPVEDGPVIFTHEPGQGGDPEYHVLTKVERAIGVAATRYSNHFQTCPQAGQHRKGGR